MPTDLHTARTRRRLDRRLAAAARLDAVAATLDRRLRLELGFLALSLVAADESDSRADVTAAAVLGDLDDTPGGAS